MKQTIKINGKVMTISWYLWHLCVLLFLLSFLAFSTWFLALGREELIRWYDGLGTCIYDHENWNSQFFTPEVKATGNFFCIGAIAVALSGIVWLFLKFIKKRKQPSKAVAFTFSIYDLVVIAGFVVVESIYWSYSAQRAAPAYDEAFSAQFSAGVNPFQSISHYVLPNNHMLFNFLNGLLFHSFADKVATGRFISLVMLLGFTLSAYAFTRRLLNDRVFAILITLALSSQFFIWGFATQARGYELYLLAEWGSLVSLIAWFMYGKRRWLIIHALGIAAGYFCLPSFLYFHTTLLLFTALYQLTYRVKDILIWKSQVAALCLTGLLYMPALCFSGLHAITNNSYVAPMGHYKTVSDFCAWMFPYFNPYIEHMFSNAQMGDHPIGIVLFFLPATLLFSPKKRLCFLTGLGWLCTWLPFFAIVIIMKRLPFERNLIGHYGVTVFALCIVFYRLANAFFYRITMMRIVIFCSLMMSLVGHFVYADYKATTGDMKEVLYEYNVNGIYTDLKGKLTTLPAGASISFSDLSFYARYIYMKGNYKVTSCGNNNGDYYVKHVTEALPKDISSQYIKYATMNEYDIYKRP